MIWIITAANLAATGALALWTIRKLKRLRVSVNLAHSDIEDIANGR